MVISSRCEYPGRIGRGKEQGGHCGLSVVGVLRRTGSALLHHVVTAQQQSAFQHRSSKYNAHREYDTRDHTELPDQAQGSYEHDCPIEKGGQGLDSRPTRLRTRSNTQPSAPLYSM